MSMSVAGIVLIVVMLFCIIVGIPISWSLLLASAASLLVDGSALSILEPASVYVNGFVFHAGSAAVPGSRRHYGSG